MPPSLPSLGGVTSLPADAVAALRELPETLGRLEDGVDRMPGKKKG